MNKKFLKTTIILCGIISAPLLLLADSYEDIKKIELSTINGNTVAIKNVEGKATYVEAVIGNTHSIDNIGEESKTIVSKEVSGNTTYINTAVKPTEVDTPPVNAV